MVRINCNILLFKELYDLAPVTDEGLISVCSSSNNVRVNLSVQIIGYQCLPLMCVSLSACVCVCVYVCVRVCVCVSVCV